MVPSYECYYPSYLSTRDELDKASSQARILGNSHRVAPDITVEKTERSPVRPDRYNYYCFEGMVD